MVRVKASVLILALIVAPVALLCGAQSDATMHCPALCPMMHDGTHTTQEQTDEPECHHGKSASPDCLMKSGCGHTLDFGLATPLPPAILCLAVEVLAPAASGMPRLATSIPSLAGFLIPPFQPPRA
jgi:hypothetical protein